MNLPEKTHGRHSFPESQWHDDEKNVCKKLFGQRDAESDWTCLASQARSVDVAPEATVKLAEFNEWTSRLETLERKLSEGRGTSIIVPLQTLDPEPFELLRELKVVIRPSDDEFIASFFDANVNASGCTVTDAVNNLKEILVKRFDRLDKTPIDKLGPAMVKQVAVLRGFIRRQGVIHHGGHHKATRRENTQET